MTSNVIHIEFKNKKHFPPGEWLREPDVCKWESNGFQCLAIREKQMGVWTAFVGVSKEHSSFSKPLKILLHEPWFLNLNVHGGVSTIGKNSLDKDLWWFGWDTSQGEDLMPLVQFDPDDPILGQYHINHTYKNLKFVIKETNLLAKQLLKIK